MPAFAAFLQSGGLLEVGIHQRGDESAQIVRVAGRHEFIQQLGPPALQGLEDTVQHGSGEGFTRPEVVVDGCRIYTSLAHDAAQRGIVDPRRSPERGRRRGLRCGAATFRRDTGPLTGGGSVGYQEGTMEVTEFVPERTMNVTTATIKSLIESET